MSARMAPGEPGLRCPHMPASWQPAWHNPCLATEAALLSPAHSPPPCPSPYPPQHPAPRGHLQHHRGQRERPVPYFEP